MGVSTELGVRRGALAASGSVTSTGRGNKLERRADRRSRGRFQWEQHVPLEELIDKRQSRMRLGIHKIITVTTVSANSL